MSEITISGVYKNAWSRLHGSKGAIWIVAILIILIAITIEYFSKWIRTDSQTVHYWLSYIIVPIVVNLAIALFYGGSFMVAIKCARDEEINLRSGFQYRDRYWPAAIVMAIVGLISNLVVIIINIPPIAQAVGRRLPYFDLLGALFSLLVYAFFISSVPLIMDKNKGIGEALSESLQKVKSHWLRIFVIFFLAYLVLFLSYLPTVIGLAIGSNTLMLIGALIFVAILIWLLPFLFLLGGDIYHRLVDKS